MRRWKFSIGTSSAPAERAPSEFRCSFCGKFKEEVPQLIGGAEVFICDLCVEVCNDIVADERARVTTIALAEPIPLAVPPDSDGLVLPCSLCRMPTGSGERVPVEGRGILCLGCVGAIEAAVAALRPNNTSSSG